MITRLEPATTLRQGIRSVRRSSESTEWQGGDPVVHLVASGGGHSAQLREIGSKLEEYRRVWITQDSPHARALQSEGERVVLLPKYDRNLTGGGHLTNIARAARLALRERPRMVISCGSGLTVPYCIAARGVGSRVVFAETMARVTSPSASGRILSRLAYRSFVQWPDLLRFYPRSQVCQPKLIDQVLERRAEDGAGTFVCVGSHDQPFDRLLRLVDRAAESGILPTPVFAQTGASSYQPRFLTAQSWLPPDEMVQRTKEATLVIAHGGTGALSQALAAGLRPLVLARERARGEHFDDHQYQLVDKLVELDLAVHVAGPIDQSHLDHAFQPLVRPATRLGPPLADAVAREVALSFA